MADLSFHAIALHNFKGFSGAHKLALDQEPGLYHVSGANKLYPELGANGVGKSTLWDALLWVLFGKTGRDAKPGSSVVPWDGDKKGLSVSLSFARGDDQYALERTRNPNHLLLIDAASGDGAKPREIAQEEIPKLLGMSEETFRRTMILGQFGSLFLDLKADAQAQMFSEALNLDVWLRAAAIAAAAAKDNARALLDLQSESSAVSALIDDLADQMSSAKSRAQNFDEDLDSKISALRKKLKNLGRELEGAKDDMPKKPERLRADDGLSGIFEQLEENAHKLAGEVALRDVAVKRYAILQSQLKHLQDSHKKKCPTCGQALSFAQFTDQVRLVSNEMHDLEITGKMRKALLLDLEDERSKLEQQRSKLKKEMAQSEAIYDKALSKYNLALDLIKSTERLEQQLEAEIERVDKSENADWAEYDRLSLRRQDKRKRAGEIKRELDAAARDNEQADFWAKAFREIRLGVIDEALLELEIAATRHAAMLGLNGWGIKFETERETSGGNLSYKFTVLLYPPGETEPIKWESYSGGESQRWQLAVSFGLSEVLLARAGVQPNIEVLDEPTRGLSPEGISDLLEHLRERAIELGRAIYFVDHHSLDKGSFDATLLVSKDKKGSSIKWL